jgi:protein phosphatase 1L
VKDGELYVSNVGDCRAVLGSRGGVATALTSDHTPGREDERLRIESTVHNYISCMVLARFSMASVRHDRA